MPLQYTDPISVWQEISSALMLSFTYTGSTRVMVIALKPRSNGKMYPFTEGLIYCYFAAAAASYIQEWLWALANLIISFISFPLSMYSISAVCEARCPQNLWGPILICVRG